MRAVGRLSGVDVWSRRRIREMGRRAGGWCLQVKKVVDVKLRRALGSAARDPCSPRGKATHHKQASILRLLAHLCAAHPASFPFCPLFVSPGVDCWSIGFVHSLRPPVIAKREPLCDQELDTSTRLRGLETPCDHVVHKAVGEPVLAGGESDGCEESGAE